MKKLSDNRVCFDEDMTVPEIDAELHAAGLLRVGYPENVEGVVIYNVTTVAEDAAERAQFAPFFTPEGNASDMIRCAMTSGKTDTYRTTSADDARTVEKAFRADPRCTDAIVVNDGPGALFVDAWGETWRVRVDCTH